MKEEEKMTDDELAEALLRQADFIEGNVSGQRYGQFGSPFIPTKTIREAAKRLAGVTRE